MVDVYIIENELDWGQRVEAVRQFKTLKEAKAYAQDFNRENVGHEVPNWYMHAEIA